MTGMTQTLVVEFTAHDRCDRCGAQAQARHQLATGELMFCGHHDRVYSERLAAVEVAVERAVQAAN